MFGIDDIIGQGLKLVNGVIDRVIPDPAQAAAAKLAVEKLHQDGDLAKMDAIVALTKAQTDINLADANSKDKFQSRWRPFIGWVCGAAFAFSFVLSPLLVGLHVMPSLPAVDMATMMPVLLGMLGLGGMRTFEKVKDKD